MLLNIIIGLLLLLAKPVYANLEIFHTCGVDDKVFVGDYDDRFEVSYDWVMEHKDPVVEIEGCTGTLITENLVITAGHCHQVKEGTEVKFFYENGDTPDVYQVKKVLESDRYPDYKIVSITGNPGVTPQKIDCGATDDLQKGDEVYIIGHPRRKPKMISAGALKMLTQSSLGYLADTSNGTSGAGVLNRDGFLIGIHAWGSCLDKENYRGYNGGNLIKRILKDSPILQRICQKNITPQ